MRSAAVLVAASLACACRGASTQEARADGVAQVFVTTGDRAKLLERQSDLRPDARATGGGITIDLDPSRDFQEMVGFGAALTDASAWLMQHRLSGTQREALLQDLFSTSSGGAGFSFTRLDMGASDFSLRHYSYDDMPVGATDPSLAHFSIDADRAETIPILKRALAINPALAVMASPWSAPAWMKTTGSMIKGTLRPEAYGPFAEYFRRFIEAYASEGIPMYAITVQNEPHYEPNDYPGMRLDPATRAKFIGQYLGPLFQRSGIRTRILDWDHNWDEPASPLAVLGDSVARRFVAGVAWHCYGGDVAAQGTVRDAHPDKDVYFTECSGGNWAPKFSDNLVWTVQKLIVGGTRNWARGVLMWNLALDEQHGPHSGGCGDCRGVVTIAGDGSVTRNEEYYALAHASRFVRRGARRVASSDATGGIENVAFRNPDGSLAAIIVNTNATGTSFAVRSRTGSYRYTLPGASVATLVWK